MADTNSTGQAPRTKLTDHEVALIAELIEEGYTYQEIAAKFEAMAKC